MNATVEAFLSPEDEKEIIQAIARAERKTSGEIRVHIENHSDLPPIARAREVFNYLEMYKTEARNGVLFYVGVSDKTFAIIGDSGIDDVVNDTFWESTKDLVIANFKEKKFKEGLINGILEAGRVLQEFFPFEKDDTNELTNEISRN